MLLILIYYGVLTWWYFAYQSQLSKSRAESGLKKSANKYPGQSVEHSLTGHPLSAMFLFLPLLVIIYRCIFVSGQQSRIHFKKTTAYIWVIMGKNLPVKPPENDPKNLIVKEDFNYKLYEIDRDPLTGLLGRGAFGAVYLAKLLTSLCSTTQLTKLPKTVFNNFSYCHVDIFCFLFN